MTTANENSVPPEECSPQPQTTHMHAAAARPIKQALMPTVTELDTGQPEMGGEAVRCDAELLRLRKYDDGSD